MLEFVSLFAGSGKEETWKQSMLKEELSSMNEKLLLENELFDLKLKHSQEMVEERRKSKNLEVEKEELSTSANELEIELKIVESIKEELENRLEETQSILKEKEDFEVLLNKLNAHAIK